MMMLLLSLFACSSAIHHITPMGAIPDAHWVVLDEDGKMWDCMSRPDGTKWKPICLEVDYRDDYVPAGEKQEK